MKKVFYEEVILDPALYFKTPEELLKSSTFDVHQKYKLLKAWELDVKLLQICDEENMGNNTEIRLLSAIHQALQTVSEKGH